MTDLIQKPVVQDDNIASTHTMTSLQSNAQQDAVLLTPPQDAKTQARIQQIAAVIDFNDPTLSIAYGASTMNAISQFADSMLAQVRSKNAGVVGEQLTELIMRIKDVNIDAFQQKTSLLSKIPIVRRFVHSVESTMIQYQSLADQVDTIAHKLDDAMIGLLRDITVLEQLYERNRDFYHEISLHISAGKEKLQHFQVHELPKLQEKANASGDVMMSQQMRDIVEKMQRFERRLHDLELSRTVAYQTAPQIRIIQTNNQTLAEKIQSSILSTIPIWKSQIVLAISLNTQRNAIQLQRDVTNTTNTILRKNAELLQQNSINVAREVERSVIDIETLREVQNRLVNTIEETVSIAREARTERLAVEKELATMEKDLHQRINAAMSR